MTSQISIRTLIPQQKRTLPIRIATSFLDRLLGLSRMQRIYATHEMQGLSKEAFSERLLEVLNVRIKNKQQIIAALPQQGPVVIASNHPFGGLEGVILARVLGQARTDRST